MECEGQTPSAHRLVRRRCRKAQLIVKDAKQSSASPSGAELRLKPADIDAVVVSEPFLVAARVVRMIHRPVGRSQVLCGVPDLVDLQQSPDDVKRPACELNSVR